ncbi:hypothetical protein JI58_03620 [Marinosulfonomonas sp. PRT-SC04]|nr:hypothetical protein JI58_03620 [Marinosulfonomonas sp. PRT-SC04]
MQKETVMHAPIIIDLQNDFYDGGALAVVEGSKVLTGSHHTLHEVALKRRMRTPVGSVRDSVSFL